MNTTDITFWHLFVDNAGHYHAFIARPYDWRYIDLYYSDEIALLLHELYNNKLSFKEIEEYYTPNADQEEITQTYEEMQDDSCNYWTIAWKLDPIQPDFAEKARNESVALILRMFAALDGVDSFLETFSTDYPCEIARTLAEMPTRFVTAHIGSETDCIAMLNYQKRELDGYSMNGLALELENIAQELGYIDSIDVRYWKDEEESNPDECDYMEIAFEVPHSQANSEFRNAIADLIAGDEWKPADIEWQGHQSWHKYTRSK